MRQFMLHAVPYFPSIVCVILWTSSLIERRKGIVNLTVLEQLVQGLFVACVYVLVLLIWPWALVGNRPRYAIYAGLVMIVAHTIVAATRAHRAHKVLPDRRASWIVSGLLVVVILPCLFAIGHVLLAPFSKDHISIAFPLEGEWSVGHGGASVLTNAHIPYADQRYALDLVKVGPDGKCFSEDGRHLEMHYSWRQPVHAPLSGIVVEAVETYADNRHGSVSGGDSRGNHVLIRSAAGEIVLVAHLRHQGVLVQKGDSVQEGQLLADVGNSGNTSAPHLHIEASRATEAGAVNVPIFFKNIGAGLRSQRRGSVLVGPKAQRQTDTREMRQ